MIVTPPQLTHWTRVPLKRMLSDATGLPVTLDNDATAAAVGERWSGAGKGVANFAYFLFGTGIGGGLILNHQVYRGGSLNAGEFGHSSVLPDGPECYCGNRGCLERLVNPSAIVAEVHRRLAEGRTPGESELARAFDRDPASVDHASIRLAAAAGDPVAAAVIDEAAEHVASVAVSIANFIDVDLIVLGGHGIQHVETRYVDVVASALATRPLSRSIRVVEVKASPSARTPPWWAEPPRTALDVLAPTVRPPRRLNTTRRALRSGIRAVCATYAVRPACGQSRSSVDVSGHYC